MTTEQEKELFVIWVKMYFTPVPTQSALWQNKKSKRIWAYKNLYNFYQTLKYEF